MDYQHAENPNYCSYGLRREVVVTKGFPQGTIISPTLWCMVIDSLLVILNNHGYFTQGYLDDVSSLVCRDFEDTVDDMMKNENSRNL